MSTEVKKARLNRKQSGKILSRRNSKAASRRSGPRKSRAQTMPKTRSVHSRKRAERVKASKARSDMGMTDLQFMARSRGIPFGGLPKSKLVRKINDYSL